MLVFKLEDEPWFFSFFLQYKTSALYLPNLPRTPKLRLSNREQTIRNNQFSSQSYPLIPRIAHYETDIWTMTNSLVSSSDTILQALFPGYWNQLVQRKESCAIPYFSSSSSKPKEAPAIQSCMCALKYNFNNSKVSFPFLAAQDSRHCLAALSRSLGPNKRSFESCRLHNKKRK